jgi:serralysin
VCCTRNAVMASSLLLGTLILCAPSVRAESADSTAGGGAPATSAPASVPATYQPAWGPIVDPFDDGMPAAFCFAPGTDPNVVAYYSEMIQYDPVYRYNLGSRWPGNNGDPYTLRWSFVPDGLVIDGGAHSDLFSSMDAKFGGNRALWISKFQACFDRWHALTGITYQRITYNGNDWDDGASWGSSGSSTRGDIRISAMNIDGPSNVLAYTYYPGTGTGGDMVFDDSEDWGSPSADYRLLRNVAMHEHGHGIGLSHVCPSIGTKLMEPYINLSYDGPQHDDIRAGQRLYGDPHEPDNSAATAFDAGAVTVGVPVVVGLVPPPSVANGALLSIDADNEVDWFKFTINNTNVVASLTVTPIGLTYDSSTQNGDGSCNSGSFVNSLAIADLNVQLIGTNGSTVLATAASQPAGNPEQTAWLLINTAGTYYAKVYEGNSPTESQLYQLTISVFPNDPTPPTPDPMTFATAPHPLSQTSIQMQATTAIDAISPPVYYYFSFGDGSTPWGTDTLFTQTNLLPNTAHTYQVTARDSATPWNLTVPSTPVTTATHIQTPSSTTIGTVTATSVEIHTPGTFSNLTLGNSGMYFACLGTGCDTGLKQWVQTTSATATGLIPNTYYGFRVKARNQVAIETAWSQLNAYVYTLAAVPPAPGLSQVTNNSLQLSAALGDNSPDTELILQCTTTTDPAWQGKYVDATGHPTGTAVWQTVDLWTNLALTGLLANTQYCFAARAHNFDGIETALSTPACAQTLSGIVRGDLNCDGVYGASSFGDINPFVLLLSNPAAWQAAYPGCPLLNGDMNCDGVVDFRDINPFVTCLSGGQCGCP